MKSILVASHVLAVLVAAGPWKRDCGQQCFNSTNACGVEFGGCWDECTIGANQRPTFAAPPCSATALPTELDTATPTTPIVSPTITSAPNDTLAIIQATEPCWTGRTICIDYIQFCGNDTHKYGGCDDVCSKKVYTPPPCTLPSTRRMPTSTKTRSKRPVATRPVCDKAKSFLCAPLNWRV